MKQIEWSGGELPEPTTTSSSRPATWRRELDAGATLYFKVVQECAKGELKWIEVPAAGVDPHSPRSTAAVLKIAADGMGVSSAATGSAKAGELSIEGAWTRATAEGAKVGAGYLTIRNTGSAADTLLSFETTVAAAAKCMT